jgi:Gram-negative bacterial TonB protein C-terminal
MPASPKLGSKRAKAGVRVALAVLAVSAAAAGVSAQRLAFTPPRLLKAELSPLPAPTIAGGGEVLIEATVDRTGRLTRPNVRRGTPPYTSMVLEAIATWRFKAASVRDVDGRDEAVDMPIAIAALYRPPVLMNTPTIGEVPKDWTNPSGDVAYPIAMAVPNYPPNARDGGVVLFEVALNEAGAIMETRGIASTGGFDSAAREALVNWRFRGGMYRSQPVPTTAYVLFGFRPPVGLGPPCRPGDPPPCPKKP